MLTADLYDKNSVFLYQCDTYLAQAVKPNESTHFKVDCHGVTQEIYEKYHSFKLQVVRRS